VAVVARSLETVDGVFTVGHTNSETHGNMIPMTSAEQNELFRLFTLYHIAYTEVRPRHIVRPIIRATQDDYYCVYNLVTRFLRFLCCRSNLADGKSID
jgi:hypothetical protein